MVLYFFQLSLQDFLSLLSLKLKMQSSTFFIDQLCQQSIQQLRIITPVILFQFNLVYFSLGDYQPNINLLMGYIDRQTRICQNFCIALALLFIINASTQNPAIMLQTPPAQPNGQYLQYSIYANSVYNDQFVYKNQPFNCSQCIIFTYRQSPQSLISNQPCFLMLNNFTSNPEIKYDTLYDLFYPEINYQQCNSILPSATTNNPKSCTISIKYNCPNPVGLFNYFDMLQIEIQGFQPMTYNILCDSSYRQNTFEVGTIILILFVSTLITILALYSSSPGLKNNRISVNLIVIGFLLTMLVLFEIFSFVDQLESTLLTFMCVMNFIFGIPGVSYCVNQILHLCSNSLFMFGVKLFNLFTFRVMHLISILISIGVMLAWFFLNKNWIINDIIFVCCTIMLVRIFKFDSLKIAVLYVILIIGHVVVATIVARIKDPSAQQSYYINYVNNTFQLQLPTINPVFQQKCSYLSLFQISYSGMLLSYLRRFDKSRNTRLYLITSLITFLVGSFIWMIFTFIGNGIVLPFGIVTDPFTFTFIILLSRTRKEFKNIWHGTFYDEEVIDKQARKTIQLALMQTKQTQVRVNEEWFAGLTLQDKDIKKINDIGIDQISEQIQQEEESERIQALQMNQSVLRNNSINQSIGGIKSRLIEDPDNDQYGKNQ